MEGKLLAINPHDRHTWRSGVHPSGMGLTDVDVAPVYLHVNQKSDFDIMIESSVTRGKCD